MICGIMTGVTFNAGMLNDVLLSCMLLLSLLSSVLIADPSCI